MTRLLIVIPCLNEAPHLPGLLDTLAADPAATEARIVVADGGSIDGSQQIVRDRAARDARITLLPNPARIQSAGVNLAVRTYGADADAFVRVDAHARYPKDYISRLIAAQSETGADTVTVSMRAVGDSQRCFQRAAAAAQNSLLGTGGSLHRAGGARRWVEHGHHALFSLAAFRAVGGYDESFSHNEDAELDLRLIRNGARILLAGDILIDYLPRASAFALARQYFNFGRGRARTAVKHRAPLRLRQLLPIAVAPVLALGCLAPLTPWAMAPAAFWLSVCLGYGAWLGLQSGSWCAAASGAPAAIMHVAWSAGFLRELARVRRRSTQPTSIEHKQA